MNEDRLEKKTLESALIDVNRRLRENFRPMASCRGESFHATIADRGGKVIALSPMSKEELEEFAPIGGVDGSVNRRGGAYPHYISLYRGLGMTTDGKKEKVEEVFTPLLHFHTPGKETDPVPDEQLRLLAEVELKAALELVEHHEMKVLMMDGGLIRYKILQGELWERLGKACVDRNILLMGLIKDIKTAIFSGGEHTTGMYDREILYGNLGVKEGIIVDDSVNQKAEEGFSSAFLRPGKEIQVVGIDVLKEQGYALEDLCRLCCALTPEHGRGVPLWLDIVDREGKISHSYMEGLLQEYLDRDVFLRFFVSERDLRTV